jgi:predicted membrane-bound mannosyltransferase
MKSAKWKFVPVLSALALAAAAAPLAHAGCGLYQPVVIAQAQTSASANHPQSLSQTLFQIDQAKSEMEKDSASPADASMVGTWKEHWYSIDSQGIPDGTEVDANYAQWHSDGTEMQVSGMRTPPSGDVCVGEWVKTGPRTYLLNHFGVSFDSTGTKLVGPAVIRITMTIDSKGQNTLGLFNLVQYDEAGNVLAHVTGVSIGTRVTMTTGFQPVL